MASEEFQDLINFMNTALPEDNDFFRKVLDDPRVAESQGGGACPEQHEGTLINGRKFYFRMRHGSARLHIAPEGKELFASHPDWSQEAFNQAWDNRTEYNVPMYADTIVYDDPYPDDDLLGFFLTDEDRNACFTRLLDQAWNTL